MPIENPTPAVPEQTDFNLAMPDEAVWDAHKDDVTGNIDVLGTRNGKYLVNVRGSIPDELVPYNLVLDTPLRVWA